MNNIFKEKCKLQEKTSERINIHLTIKDLFSFIIYYYKNRAEVKYPPTLSFNVNYTKPANLLE